MKIGFLLYPTASVKIAEDSSFWIMRELAGRGHSVVYFESGRMSLKNGSVLAHVSRARLDRRRGYLPSPPSPKLTDLSTFDAIFIRKEPPFDTEYLYALQMLDTLKKKVFVMNDPAGIALSNEKLFSLQFRRYAPESVATSSAAAAAHFVRETGRVIVKPLDDKGGAGIFATHPKDRNLASLLDLATQGGQRTVLVQRFVAADQHGDKRIVLLNGRILGAFLRRPPWHDYRANLSTGGSMHRASVNAFERKMVESMTPELLKRGLYFVGLDVIGKHLTEINVTSPAGIPEIHQYDRSFPEKQVADFIERSVIRR